MNATLASCLPIPALGAPRTAAKVRSAEELRAALRGAGRSNTTPDLTLLDRVLRLDSRHRRLEAQAGVQWQALSAYLAAQSIDGAGQFGVDAACFGIPATVGECVMRNAACPDGSPFATHVVALALVTADGELRRASRSQQRELFQRVIGGHGLIAALYSVTLDIDSLSRAFCAGEPPVTLDAACACDAGADVMRFMVPPSKLQPFLAELRQVLDDYRLTDAGLSVRKALPDTESVLRWATEELALVEVRLAARPTLPAQVAATQVRRALIAAALACGGRFDLATGFDASREQVDAAYPMLKALLAEKLRGDPQERLGGPLYVHYRSLFRRESCDVRWGTH